MMNSSVFPIYKKSGMEFLRFFGANLVWLIFSFTAIWKD